MCKCMSYDQLNFCHFLLHVIYYINYIIKVLYIISHNYHFSIFYIIKKVTLRLFFIYFDFIVYL